MAPGIMPSKAGEVAPCAGAWIEMAELKDVKANSVSLPVRERGLK